MRVSMLVEMKAAAARAEAIALRSDLDSLGKTALATGKDAGGAATGVDALGAAVGKTDVETLRAVTNTVEFDSAVAALRTSINPLAGALEQAQAAIRNVATAEELGALTSMEAALAHDQLTRSVDRIIANMAQYASSADIAAAANARIETTVQRLIASNTGLVGSTGGSIAAQLQHGAALDDLRARFDPLFAASRRYELELREIAEAERLGAISATGAGQARERAAQSLAPLSGQLRQVGTVAQNTGAYVTQLGFQANDVMVMMAAGQNPMMMAMQQGTQVSQVFQMMKKDGMSLGPAIRGALMSMVSPMSLVTMGAIALAAYGVQALIGLGDEAKKASFDLKILKEGAGEVSSVLQRMQGFNFANTFNGMSADATTIRNEFETILDVIEQVQAESLQAAINQMRDATGLQDAMKDFAYQSDMAGRLGNEAPKFEYMGLDSLYEARFVMTSINEIEGQTREEILKSVDATAEKLMLMGLLTPEVKSLLATMAEELGLQNQINESVKAKGGIVDKAKTSAAEMTALLNAEAGIVLLTAKYGADSLEVSYARVAAERAVQVELLASRGITGTLADKAMRAWDAARGIAAVNMAAGIGEAAEETKRFAAAVAHGRQQFATLFGVTTIVTDGLRLAGDEADRLAAAGPRGGWLSGAIADASALGGALWDAASAAVWLQNNKAGGTVDLANQYRSYGQGRVLGEAAAKEDGALYGGNYTDIQLGRTKPTSTAGGGGKKAETDSVLELIRAEERELAVLRETDPVKRELLEKSEQLKGSTTAQRSELEGLIRTRMAEKTALDATKAAQDELNSTMKSAFTGWLTGAHSFKDALGQIIGKMAEMAASSAFDMIFNGSGGGGGGGLFGDILGSLFGGAPKKADGGRIGGAGGPREDNHLIAVSTGEYIVNAAATANALPLLEALNAGMPLDRLIDFIGGSGPRAFANGGGIGVGSSAPTSWSQARSASSSGGDAEGSGSGSGPRVLEQHIHIHGATGNTEIRQMVAEGVQYGIELHDREVLPTRVMDVVNNQRVMGR
jgi:hypothetical protein